MSAPTRHGRHHPPGPCPDVPELEQLLRAADRHVGRDRQDHHLRFADVSPGWCPDWGSDVRERTRAW